VRERGALVADCERVTGWQRARGKGGFLRATWAEVSEMIAAAQLHTIKITSAPIMYQVHATAAWMIFGVWPFSRLVHAWSFPLYYLWRPYIVYRRRSATRPSEPGTSGRRWRRIGSRY
jgi:nitrate reductase gamma subunit